MWFVGGAVAESLPVAVECHRARGSTMKAACYPPTSLLASGRKIRGHFLYPLIFGSPTTIGSLGFFQKSTCFWVEMTMRPYFIGVTQF